VVNQSLIRCEELRLDDREIVKSKFWHNRLIELNDFFDESRRSRLFQEWHNNKDGQSWYTFWVAVLVLFLTVILGLLQSIEGALQCIRLIIPMRFEL
jgi:hypothetical protein